VNEKLRRPAFVAESADGVRLKGVLSKQVIKVGFIPEQAEEQRERFERWLSSL
jgi:hypothetical protein